MNISYVLGADIGGSHITVGLVDMAKKKVLADSIIRKRVDSSGVVDEIIKVWSAAILEVFTLADLKPSKIGVAMPGPFDYENGISYIKGLNKYDALYSLNIKEILSKSLNVLPSQISFMNDAPCFLQGEVFSGIAKGYQNIIGITLGTGFGSAYYNGRAIDAELWQAPFNNDIAENNFSTDWFKKRFKKVYGTSVADVKEIVDLLDTNPDIQAIFDEYGSNLAKFFQPILLEKKPELIVCGGNISKAFHLFSPSMFKQFNAQNQTIEVKVASLGEQSALIGAAAIWENVNQNNALKTKA